MERAGQGRILDLQDRLLLDLPVTDIVSPGQLFLAPDGDRLQPFGPHHGSEARPSDEMALVVSDRGKADEILPGRTDRQHLDPRIGCLEDVRGFVNVPAPETGSVGQSGLAIRNGKHHRRLRPAGDHDPVIARPLQLRAEVPAAGRLPPDPRQRRPGADGKARAPGEAACHHRSGHHHEGTFRRKRIGLQRESVQEELRSEGTSTDEFPEQIVRHGEGGTATFRQVDPQKATSITIGHTLPSLDSTDRWKEKPDTYRPITEIVKKMYVGKDTTQLE